MYYRWQGQDLILNVRVQPRASKTGLAEVLGDAIKLRLTSPPVDGKANQQLITVLAKQFGVAKSAIVIVSGEKGRDKRVCIRQPAKLPQGIMPADR